ncbi:MAG: thiamine pyrophosphate-dependent dehydrogenase E1 component subunit alpha [Pseudomonadota bacterium]|nr:thiamine pyrophosphate-dependent dehydrogenase E1 component subunit alpha [Pseudomonadota bacterium]
MTEQPDRATLVAMYRAAIRQYQNDARLREVIKLGRMAMPYYSGRGQEIIPAAVSVNMSDRDYIVTTYRGIHDMVAKGIPLDLLWAELAGRSTGACKGKGGAMHITHPGSGIMVTTGIVGSSLPIANGLALAAQLRNDDRVTVAYFGDGASNIGAFHEALNLASVWKLPVVFVCQNNRYAEHTKYSVGTSIAHLSDRAAAYEMPGIRVDGNDPLAMYAAANQAVNRARAGGGPTFIEAMTFRFFGHYFGDADTYMDPGEKESWVEKDPIPRFRAWMMANGHATEAELTTIETAIEDELDAAVEFALSSPFPSLDELRKDVFREEVAR